MTAKSPDAFGGLLGLGDLPNCEERATSAGGQTLLVELVRLPNDEDAAAALTQQHQYMKPSSLPDGVDLGEGAFIQSYASGSQATVSTLWRRGDVVAKIVLQTPGQSADPQLALALARKQDARLQAMSAR